MKITKLPPAPQRVFFQDCQFDKNIGEGTDPQQYVSGKGTQRSNSSKKGRSPRAGDDTVEVQTQAAKFHRKAVESLKNHPNEKKILKVLKERLG